MCWPRTEERSRVGGVPEARAFEFSLIICRLALMKTSFLLYGLINLLIMTLIRPDFLIAELIE